MSFKSLREKTGLEQVKDAFNLSKHLVPSDEKSEGIVLSIEENAKYLSPILIKEINHECSPDVQRSNEVYLSYKQYYAHQGE